MDLTDKSQLIKYIKQNGLWAKKSLGQNFLVDREALDRIVAAAELNENDTVLEIGPGLGTLTGELVQRAGRVVAVEKDEKLADILTQKFKAKSQNCNFEIISGDALEFDTSLSANKLTPNAYKVVANIPYYITSKILEKFLSAENKPSLIVLLVQKEVAERICAKPGDLSVLAVSVQYYGEPEIVDIVPRDSFFPVPEVDSAILKINTQNPKPKSNDKEFFKVVKTGFAARRKTLFNNLKNGTHLNSGQIEEILDKMGLSKNTRAQELSVEQWKGLADRIKNSE